MANHSAGSAFFDYRKDLPGLAEWSTPQKCWGKPPGRVVCNHDWSNNQYFLSGKLEALDVAGEWFLQQSDSKLFFFPPETGAAGAAAAGACAPPLPGAMEYKARDFVITQPSAAEAKGCGSGSSLSLALTGLALHGGTFSLPCCHSCRLDRLDLSFPTYSREIVEMDAGHEGHDYTPAKKVGY